MKLRFEVDQASCLRKGIDCPNSIITVEVDPAKMPQKERDLIADRLEGIDVCALWSPGSLGEIKKTMSSDGKPYRIKAKTPDYSGLMEVVLENQASVETAIKQKSPTVVLRGKP